MTSTRLLFAAASLFALAAGCGNPPNFLDGSIKESHDLTFDAVELRFLTDQSVFQLSYFNSLDTEDPSAGKDTVAKLTFNEPDGGAVVDKKIDLTADTAGARVERVTARNDPFPSAFTKGEVTFHTKPADKKTVDGDFAITFDNGKTLDGGFEAPLEDVSF